MFLIIHSIAIFGVIVLAVSGYVINKSVIKKPYITPDEFTRFAGGFAAFSVVFIVFYYIIGFNPLVDPGTENYMDFGFMQTMYRATHL